MHTSRHRHGDDHEIERSSRAVGQDQRGGASAVAFDLPNRRAEMHLDAVIGQPLAQAVVKDFDKRPPRQHELLASREAKKPSRKTFRAAASDARSTVSPKALTSTTDQNRSMVRSDCLGGGATRRWSPRLLAE